MNAFVLVRNAEVEGTFTTAEKALEYMREEGWTWEECDLSEWYVDLPRGGPYRDVRWMEGRT